MELIRHAGIVTKILPQSIIVTIASETACAGCHANGACSISDVSEKEIEISIFRNSYSVGQTVTVLLHGSSGLKALLLGYLLPFIVLFVTLVIAITATGNEIFSGLLSLGMLIPYYTVLFFNRNRLKKAFNFELEEN